MQFKTALFAALASIASATEYYNITDFHAHGALGNSAVVSFRTPFVNGTIQCFATSHGSKSTDLGPFLNEPCFPKNSPFFWSLAKDTSNGLFVFNFSSTDYGGSFTFPEGSESTYTLTGFGDMGTYSQLKIAGNAFQVPYN